MNVAQALVEAFALPPLPESMRECWSGTVCAMTGLPITHGYPLDRVISDATADVGSTFPYRSRFVSEPVARAFAQQLRGNILAVEMPHGWRGVRPMIALKSATEDRPAWRNVLQQIVPGMRTVIIMSDEAQRRLWPRATVGYVSVTWPILLNDSSGCRQLQVSRAALLRCLDLIESIYRIGFSKDAMRVGLLTSRSMEPIRTIGLVQTAAHETALAPWRTRPEFSVALFIAQKEEDA